MKIKLFFILIFHLSINTSIAKTDKFINQEIDTLKFAVEKIISEMKLSKHSRLNGEDIITSLEDSFYYIVHQRGNVICQINLRNDQTTYFRFDYPEKYTISNFYCNGKWLVLQSDYNNDMMILRFDEKSKSYSDSRTLIEGNLKFNSEIKTIIQDTLFIVNKYPTPNVYINYKEAISIHKINLSNIEVFQTSNYSSELFEFYLYKSKNASLFGSELVWLENNAAILNIVNIHSNEQKKFTIKNIPEYDYVFKTLSDSSINKIKELRKYATPVLSIQALFTLIPQGYLMQTNLYKKDSIYLIMVNEVSKPADYCFYLRIDTTNQTAQIEKMYLYYYDENLISENIQSYFYPNLVYSQNRESLFDGKSSISFEIVGRKKQLRNISTKQISEDKFERKLNLRRPKIWIIKSSVL